MFQLYQTVYELFLKSYNVSKLDVKFWINKNNIESRKKINISQTQAVKKSENMSTVSPRNEKVQSYKTVQNLPNLPRFNRQFIGIGHQLQQKRKERRKIEQEERAIANRVIFLQKQQLKAQKSFHKKKSQLDKMLQTIDRNNHEKEQKQRLRQMRQIQLQVLREQNKNRRIFHKEVYKSVRYDLEKDKHNEYSRIKSFIKEKQQQKRDFIFEDIKEKKDQWISMNIQKEKGKLKIDKFYKKKNVEHTLNYLEKIQKEQLTKQQKINTIKHLQDFQTALKLKLQESTFKVSQVQEKILKTSRTLEPRNLSSSSAINKGIVLPRTKRQTPSILSQFDVKNQQNGINLSFQNNEQGESQRLGYLTGRKHQRNHSLNQKSEEQIEERIQNGEEHQMSGFKIIRTTRRRRKNTKNKYKEYQLF